MTESGPPGHAQVRGALGPKNPVNPDDRGSTVPTDNPEGARGFESLYRDHFGFVYRSVRRLGVPDAFVEDALQDVFLVAYRRRADFEGRSSERTWLFGIALRVVRNHRRRMSRKDQHEALPEHLSDPNRNPEQAAQVEEARVFLQGFLDGLDEGKRSVFILAELEQATAPEIADALEVSVNTVYSRLRAARKAFEAATRRHAARKERP